jgi:CheY-like chemotaxis protein
MHKIPTCGEMPIIALTVYALGSDRQRALESRFSAHLAKPTDLTGIEHEVEMASGLR